MVLAIARKSSSLLSVMDKHSFKLLMVFALMVLGKCETQENDTIANKTETQQHQPTSLNKQSADIKNSGPSKEHSTDMEEFQTVMAEYVEDVLNREKINLMPGVYIEKKAANISSEKKSLDGDLITTIKRFGETHALRVDLARATTETGRLFFFKGK